LLLKQQAAKANRRVGDIHCQLGDYEKSIEAYDKAVKLFEKIGGNDLEIARIESRLGNVFRETGEEDFATASFYHARRLLEAIHQANPDSAEAKHELARTLYLISRHRPPSPEQQRPPPRGHSAGLNRAIDLLTGLQAKQPNNPDHSFLLALCYRERDGGRGMLNQQTLELLEGLCQQHPEVPEYQFELAETLCRVGVHHLSGSQAKESVRQLERSLKWLDTLVNDHPNIPEYRKTKAHAHHRLGTLWRHSDFEIDSAEPTDAIKQAFSNLRLAVEAQAEIHKQFPESPAELLWLARMRESLARCLLQDDQPEQALELVEESIANLGQLTVGGDFDAAMLHSNIFQHHTRAEILDALGRDEEAAKSWKTLDEFRKKLRAID